MTINHERIIAYHTSWSLAWTRTILLMLSAYLTVAMDMVGGFFASVARERTAGSLAQSTMPQVCKQARCIFGSGGGAAGDGVKQRCETERVR